MYENKLKDCESDVGKMRVNVMRVCMERWRKSVGSYKEMWQHEREAGVQVMMLCKQESLVTRQFPSLNEPWSSRQPWANLCNRELYPLR